MRTGRHLDLRSVSARPQGAARISLQLVVFVRQFIHYCAREVGGGRVPRQPGQIRKEAAPTSQTRVVCQPPTRRRTPILMASETRMAKSTRKTSQSAGSDGGTPADAGPYVVLARKYRPQTFDDLIGQSAMVTTLKNAFDAERIAQAYMLTGVRGVGKTTTARILARALNYSRPDDAGGPVIDMPELGEHCAAIMQSRHPDVLEMDAASNTGIDNIREIIESARYKPLSARYKVYIIDEVHMLSKGAFNALLKTLEEPPDHVKFIFATTEVRKVPVTVLSRCQRFDLRRVDVPELSAHLKMIAKRESAKADEDALALIARAAEGSVRDALSILDQAIAMGIGQVSVDIVRDMLGLADRGRIFDLLETIFAGDAANALSLLEGLHGDGADALQILSDLAEAVHITTRVKAVGPGSAGEGLSAAEARRAEALSDKLSVPLLSRAWQMLIKGLEDAARAPNPVAAAEMVLIRLTYTADLPPPDEIIRAIGARGKNSAERSGETPKTPGKPDPTASQTSQPAPSADPPRAVLEPTTSTAAEPIAEPENIFVQLTSFEDVVALAGAKRDAMLVVQLEEHVAPVSFEPGLIEIRPLGDAPKGLAGDLKEKLEAWTGQRWGVVISNEPGERPLGERKRKREAAELAAAREHPAVQAVLEEFPEAEIMNVRRTKLQGDN